MEPLVCSVFVRAHMLCRRSIPCGVFNSRSAPNTGPQLAYYSTEIMHEMSAYSVHCEKPKISGQGKLWIDARLRCYAKLATVYLYPKYFFRLILESRLSGSAHKSTFKKLPSL